ncbi:DUF6049 family protein [Microbacterium sp. 179-I 3D3 NHS]|uniref:DUF6049 family protein n=1 Tax=Microbacterium sp. 179-I 3D3 NHS TaxID=3142382 RepID=UPI0039A1F245
MSVTPLETGFRARLHRLARTTGILAIALTLGASAVPSAATAAETPPPDDASTVELHVSAGLHGTVAPGSSTSTLVTVRNETGSELSAGRVHVEINPTPLVDADAVDAWLDDETAPGSFTELGSESTDPVEADGSATTSVDVPSTALGDLGPGVYALRAELTGATTGGPSADDEVDRDATATSVVVVRPTRTEPVGVLVPITATPADGVLLTADELAALTGAEGALTAQLDGVAGTTAVLAVDPSIPAAIRALGTAAPEQATAWLTRLDALPNARFALQFGDADAAVQAQAGLTGLLQPLTLAPYLTATNFPLVRVTPEPTDAGDETPAPTPAPTEVPALPDDDELTALDGALPGLLWPRGEIGPDDLAAFETYLGDGTTTVVPSSSVGGQSSAHAVAGDHDLLVTDASTSAALSDAAAETDSAARERLLAAAAAHLFLAGSRAPGAPLLVGLDRDETRSSAALRDAVSAVDSPGFDLSLVRDAAPAPVAVSSEPLPTGALDVANLLADEQTLVAFSSILTDPQVLLASERIRILRTIAVGSSGQTFAERVVAHRALTAATLASVSIPPSSTIQLLTANADLPIRVRNDLPWPVTVRLTASPSDPRLEVKPMIETVVQPYSTIRVKVPVSARVGSGEVDLRLSLYSPSGVVIQSEQTVRVAVRAEWEGIGLGIFGGLIVLLIGLGVVRTVRRKRLEAAVAGAADAAALEAAEPKDGRGE